MVYHVLFYLGLPPFYDEDVNVMYQKIINDELRFPPDISPQARDLLTRLLNREATSRLGANGAEEIKSHVFFSSINWKLLAAKKIAPPFKPSVVRIIF